MSRVYDFYGVCTDTSLGIRIYDTAPPVANLNDGGDASGIGHLTLMMAHMATVSGAGAGTADTGVGNPTLGFSAATAAVPRLRFDIAPSLRLCAEDAATVLRVLVQLAHAQTLPLPKVYAWRETFAAIGVAVDDVVFHAVKRYDGVDPVDDSIVPWLVMLQPYSDVAKHLVQHAAECLETEHFAHAHAELRSSGLLALTSAADRLLWFQFLSARELDKEACQWSQVAASHGGVPGGFTVHRPCFVFDVFADVFDAEQRARFEAHAHRFRTRLTQFQAMDPAATPIIAGGFMDFLCCSALVNSGEYPRTPMADIDVFVSRLSAMEVGVFQPAVVLCDTTSVATAYPALTSAPSPTDDAADTTPVQVVLTRNCTPVGVITSFDTTHCCAFMQQDLRPMASASAIVAWLTRVLDVVPGRSLTRKRRAKLLLVLGYSVHDGSEADSATCVTARNCTELRTALEASIQAAAKKEALVRALVAAPRSAYALVTAAGFKLGVKFKAGRVWLSDAILCAAFGTAHTAEAESLRLCYCVPQDVTTVSATELWALEHKYDYDCAHLALGHCERFRKWGEAFFGQYATPQYAKYGRAKQSEETTIPVVDVCDMVARLSGYVLRAPCELTESCAFSEWFGLPGSTKLAAWLLASAGDCEARELLFAPDGGVPQATPLLHGAPSFVVRKTTEDETVLHKVHFVLPEAVRVRVSALLDKGLSVSRPAVRITWRGYVKDLMFHDRIAGIVVDVCETSDGLEACLDPDWGR